jgi:hypothetical protein
MAVTNFAVSEPIFVIIQKGYTVNLILFVIVNGYQLYVMHYITCTKLYACFKKQDINSCLAIQK